MYVLCILYSMYFRGANLGEQGGQLPPSHNVNYIFYFYLIHFIIIYTQVSTVKFKLNPLDIIYRFQ